MERLKNRKIIFISFVCALVTLLLCSKSSFFYRLNNGCDMNYYFTVGKSILFNNKVLYKEIYDHKGLIIYLIYGLSYIFEKTAFHFVFVIEVISGTVFLTYSYKTISLFRKNISVLCIVILSIIAFGTPLMASGGSVEELALPFLAYGLYVFLRYKKDRWGKCELPYRTMLIMGILTSILFWIKYTLTGLFVCIIAIIIIELATNKRLKKLLLLLLSYIGGFAIVSAPCLIYFIANNAIFDLWKVYFINNIFGYARIEYVVFRLSKIMLFAVFIAALCIILYNVISKIKNDRIQSIIEKVKKSIKRRLLIIELLFIIFFTFVLSGWFIQRFNYYLLPLMVFAPFIIVIIDIIIEKLKLVKLRRYIFIAVTLLVVPLIFVFGIAPEKILKDDSAYVQIQFAKTINKSRNPTLLNYHELDGGFYTAADIFPICKYPSDSNCKDDKLLAEQEKQIKNGDFEYVVTWDNDFSVRFKQYKRIQSGYDDDRKQLFGRRWYLYKKIDN